MDEQESIGKAIAQEIVARIKDDSVSIIWNEKIENLVRESLSNAFGGKEIDDKIFNHQKDDVIFDALEAIEDNDKFDKSLSMVLQTAKKNFTADIPGILFLTQNNAWAVVNFGEELVPFLKGEALEELHEVAEYIDNPTFLEPFNALINKYPQLRIGRKMTTLETLVKEQISKLDAESSNEQIVFEAVLDSMVGYYQSEGKDEESQGKALTNIVYNLRSVKGDFPKFAKLTAGKYFDEAVKVLGKLKKVTKDEEKKQAIEKVKNHIAD